MGEAPTWIMHMNTSTDTKMQMLTYTFFKYLNTVLSLVLLNNNMISVLGSISD